MNFTPFIEYCTKHIKGDEKGEAQTFLDHFFTALGYEEGYKGAGADCEYRIKNEKKKTTSFADLVWKPRVLIEMKKQRTAAHKQYNMSLRDLYRLLEQPGANPIKDLHAALDKAVMEAYNFDNTKDILTQLLALNLAVADKENNTPTGSVKKVQPPGLPQFVKNKEDYVSDDCVRFEWG